MNRQNIMRALGYLAGVFLFFAPFAYYQKTLAAWLQAAPAGDIHDFCLRIPLLNALTGKPLEVVSVAFISLVLLVVTAFLLGPVFCGRLCASGALPEYLSRLVPDKYKIDWQKSVSPVPIRYGFLAGYLVSPLVAGSIACALCNYNFLERLVVGGIQRDIGVLGSTAMITAILWLGIFGILAKGGRGFCSYLCPVGAVQSAVHSLGARLGFTYKLKLLADKCVGCGQCARQCPMGALSVGKEGLHYQVLNCVTCRQCEDACPKKALAYGVGERGWRSSRLETPAKEGALEYIK
ncbi:MAG TPA: 4Fe-4S binding protein [Patescibacteria group bacterium]|nr:4Fe-4S binding protein [Patescibacteria group bacterium]